MLTVIKPTQKEFMCDCTLTYMDGDHIDYLDIIHDDLIAIPFQEGFNRISRLSLKNPVKGSFCELLKEYFKSFHGIYSDTDELVGIQLFKIIKSVFTSFFNIPPTEKIIHSISFVYNDNTVTIGSVSLIVGGIKIKLDI